MVVNWQRSLFAYHTEGTFINGCSLSLPVVHLFFGVNLSILTFSVHGSTFFSLERLEMKKQLTGNELLNIPPGQVWSLEMHQRLAETPSLAAPLPSLSIDKIDNIKMDGLSDMVAKLNQQKQVYLQELKNICFSPIQQFLPATEFIFPAHGNKVGRPFKKPSFPIKAIWCKTVICLMDMECDLPERLDYTVSSLHGMPRYLTAQEDYVFNQSPEAQKARWKVYPPLRNYVGPEIEDMVEFICAIDGCNQFFKTRDLVVDHVFSFHKLFPPTVFKCNWAECEREDHFGAFYQVEHHMSLHKEERPYLCTTPGCSKSYRRLENLRTHMRTHSGEKPYKCKYEFCDRRFTNASDRAKHENRTHSTVKGFGCYFDDCFKMYTDPSSLRKHIINAHGAEAYCAHKKNKASERKKKVAQKMIERNYVSIVPEGSGGPIRNSSRCPSILSQSSLTTAELSMSPRSSSSNDSSEMTSSSQISPLPTVSEASTPASQPAISGGINFSISRIMEGIPRPSPPPTTPMYDIVKPIPRAALFPPSQKLPQIPRLTNLRLLPPLFPVQSLSSLVPPVVNPMPLLAPQMQFLLAHKRPININQS